MLEKVIKQYLLISLNKNFMECYYLELPELFNLLQSILNNMFDSKINLKLKYFFFIIIKNFKKMQILCFYYLKYIFIMGLHLIT